MPDLIYDRCKDLRPRGSLKFEHMYFAIQAAADGLGVVLAPPFPAIYDINRQAFYKWLLREGGDTERSMVGWAVSPESHDVETTRK
jgi:LysR family glycine cleavage system transcriptional activator